MELRQLKDIIERRDKLFAVPIDDRIFSMHENGMKMVPHHILAKHININLDNQIYYGHYYNEQWTEYRKKAIYDIKITVLRYLNHQELDQMHRQLTSVTETPIY